MACSPNAKNAVQGLCSTTPCALRGLYFAVRTLHLPNGAQQPAGYQCVTLDQASVRPGLSAADVYAAIRQVKLPGGHLTITPDHRGLANLPSFFWLQGATQPPVDLPLAGSTIHAEFRVVAYRWAFGDGQSQTTSSPGAAGQASQVQVAYRGHGRYRVQVLVGWVASAWLDGEPVGQVEGLSSRAAVTYPVAELKTILTG
jgi:hypothetical protein